jgi:hypothetical protein
MLTILIQLLYVSQIAILSSDNWIIPDGKLNSLLKPICVIKLPFIVTILIQLLPVSQIAILPLDNWISPVGLQNSLLPVP